MSTMLDKIIEEVRQLPLDEQRQLQEQLHSIIPSPTENELEDAFERALITAGIFTDRADLRSQFSQPSPPNSFEPVTITGKLVSEIVVEDRR